MLQNIQTKERTQIECLDSNTRILLQKQLSRRIRIPGSTSILKRNRIRQSRRNLRLALHKLHRETLTSMPRNMAMQKPRARVVLLERDGEVTVSGKGGDVATGRVDEV
jgi:hypothetical protein